MWQIRCRICHFDCKQLLGVNREQTVAQIKSVIRFVKTEIDGFQVGTTGIQLPLASLRSVQELNNYISNDDKKRELVIRLFP